MSLEPNKEHPLTVSANDVHLKFKSEVASALGGEVLAGGALLENAVYDEYGQLLTGSYMDYCMPRADDVPEFVVDTTVTPCTHNPLGVKGCGEAGAIGSPAAIINAVTDAVGVNNLSMRRLRFSTGRSSPGHGLPPLSSRSSSRACSSSI